MARNGELKVGDRVIVGRHNVSFLSSTGYENWVSEMQAYVGKTRTVTRIVPSAREGYEAVVLDIDSGYHYWYVYALTRINGVERPQDAKVATSVDDEHLAMLRFFGTPASKGWTGYSRKAGT